MGQGSVRLPLLTQSEIITDVKPLQIVGAARQI